MACGIDSAQDGIGQIVNALSAGQQAPPSDRQQVADGLNCAFTALANITSADPAVTQNLSKVQQELKDTGTAGDGVLADCK